MAFTAMVRRGLIQTNPFDGVQVPATTDQSRDVYVPRADVLAVMEQAPDAEWRAILALSRFGGLRCPSEVLSLKWEHIHWDRQRITVISPKTTRHPNGGQRIIPLFPDLIGPLQEAWEQAGEKAAYVVDRHRSQAEKPGGWRNTNFRTTLQKMIQRAGIDPWPKPFHAMRASHETDLLERFPIQVVAKWLGHSPKIALAQYARTTDDHFQAAVAPQRTTRYPTRASRVRRRNSPSEGERNAPHHGGTNAAKVNTDKGLRRYTKQDGFSGKPPIADGEGFEPPVHLLGVQQFSRLPP
jgi:integrase